MVWDNYPNDFNIKIVSLLLLICNGCLLKRNYSIQGEDYKYDNKINGGHYGPLSDNYGTQQG